jgi:hypothetical protein
MFPPLTHGWSPPAPGSQRYSTRTNAIQKLLAKEHQIIFALDE